MSEYLETTAELYREAAIAPREGLCCTTSPVWRLPGMHIPKRMLEMNYGCGATVHPRDLVDSPTVLYVGVGGGMELLQFAYFSRRPGGVLGVDCVSEMLAAAHENLLLAASQNEWFSADFVTLQSGDALSLPVEAETVDIVAQNCLFNIFEAPDLKVALAEACRVLRPRGKCILSDPISPVELPKHLRKDNRLRAMCLSGAQTYETYIDLLSGAGFGAIEVRARRPYRILDPKRFAVQEPILLESVEVAAVKEAAPRDGPCVFTGRTAIYCGGDDRFDDGNGHLLLRDQPTAVCDKTAANLAALGRPDIYVTEPTWFYDGGGCC